MIHSLRAAAVALIAMLALAGCSSPSVATPGPGSSSPDATATSGEPTSPPVAGEPCSFLTAEEIGAILGTVPVEVAERPGRGDCDYWLTAAKDAKVNIGVTTGPDAISGFEITKGLGEPQSVDLGDEAYSIFNESIGTLVVVRKGDSVAVVQLFGSADAAAELADATSLAQAVVEKL